MSVFMIENNAVRLEPPEPGGRVEALVTLGHFPKKQSPCAPKACLKQIFVAPYFWESRLKVSCLDTIDIIHTIDSRRQYKCKHLMLPKKQSTLNSKYFPPETCERGLYNVP